MTAGRYSPDELADFAQDFDTSVTPDRDADPSNAVAAREAPPGTAATAIPSTPTAPPHPGRPVEDQARDRDDRNVVALRGRRAPSHALGRATPPQHPELERAAFVSALDMARTAYLEGDRATVSVHLAVADRLARGRVG